MAEQSTALIYTIGIFDDEDRDRNPRVLRRLAGETGGEAFFPTEFNEAVAICQRIARDIRHQYTIGYHSAGTSQPGAYRTIRVAIGGPDSSKFLVRTRAGYIPGDASRPLRDAAGR